MRRESQARSEAIVLRNLLAGLALETKLIRLQHQLRAKRLGDAAARTSGTAERRQWVQSPSSGQWASLHEDRPGEPSPQDPPPLTESTTLEDGTRVLSIRIHAGR